MAFHAVRVSNRQLGRLSDEQLVVMARAGCSLAAEVLARRYRGMVEGKARRYHIAGGDADDVVQEGMVGLVKAIRDFSADRPCGFRHFAELCVTRQIVTAVRRASRHKHGPLNRAVSLDAAVEGEGEIRVAGWLADADAAVADRVVRAMAVGAVVRACVRDELSALERKVFVAYVAGMGYGEIARLLRRKPKQVDNALQRAKRKIARRLLAVL